MVVGVEFPNTFQDCGIDCKTILEDDEENAKMGIETGKWVFFDAKGANRMIFIGEYDELLPNKGYPSMKDSFCDAPYEGQDIIYYYLTHGM